MTSPASAEDLDGYLDAGIEKCMALNFREGLACFDYIISRAAPGSEELAAALFCRGIGLTARAIVTNNPADLESAEDHINAGNEVLS